ncbi:MAG: NUDIX domain-containing protein [Fidelibacterota bacterium]
MKHLQEKRLSSRNIYTGRLLDVWIDEVKLPNGRTSLREYIKHPGAAVMIPILPDGTIGFIRQFRYPMGRSLIELPAGKLDPGESPLITAKRELAEEIGYEAGKLTQLTEIHPCIGYSNERMWLFLAEDLTPVSKNMDHDEFIDFIPLKLPTALEMVWAGEITDVKTVIGIFWAGKLL